jgi:hypothetical protein
VLTSTQDLVSLGRRLNLQPPVVDFRQVGDLEGRELSTAEAHAKLRASSARSRTSSRLPLAQAASILPMMSAVAPPRVC